MTVPLDGLERRVASFGAALAAVVSVALWAPALDRFDGIVLTAIGLAMAAFLALAARSGRRLPTGVAAMLLAFGPWSFAWVVGFPYLCLAAWLLFRHGRARTAPRRTEGPEEPDQPEHRHRRRPRPEGEAAARSRPHRPEANKRYTPPQRRR